MAIVEYVSPEELDRIDEEVADAICRNASDEEIERITAKMPMPPYFAKYFKDKWGLEGLLATNFNLYDAVQEYGEDFLKE